MSMSYFRGVENMPGSSSISENHKLAMAVANETTPISSSSTSSSISQRAHQQKTPCKQYIQGQLYNSQQYRTPSTRTQAWSQAVGSSMQHTPRSADLNAHRATPKLHTPSSSSASSHKSTQNVHTPHGIPKNPFDANLIDKLDGPVFSPNVFAHCTSAEQTPKSFKWTVDELAMIKPVDIDEMPVQSESQGQDQDLERRAQEAIDAYFAQNIIVPSPWTDSAKKKPFILPRTPRTPNDYESPMVFSQRRSVSGDKAKSVGVKNDAVCQTTLTLPPDFDLKKVLGEHYTHSGCDQSDGATGDMLSTSSLRRKLFFHGEESQAPSPVKPDKSRLNTAAIRTAVSATAARMDFDVSPVVSPAKHANTPQQPRRTSPRLVNTPGSDQFSSSPISSPSKSLTPFLRRCSTDPNLMMDSPGFSPIGAGSGERGSQGLHTPLLTPMCRPLQATPSSGKASSALKALDSPGMSPIVLQTEGSYVSTPQSNSRSRKLDLGQHRVPVPLELLALHSPKVDFTMNAASPQHDLSVQDMETDDLIGQPPHKGLHGNSYPDSDRLSFSASNNHPFTDIRRRTDADQTCYSDDASSSDQDTPQQIYFTSDTGYNTNSLQLTSTQDTGLSLPLSTAITACCEGSSSAHTNLTHQFSSLPFTTSSSQDTGLELDIDDNDDDASLQSAPANSDTSKPRKAVVRHLASKQTVDGGCEVFRRARRYLGRSASMDDSTLATPHDVKMRLFGGGPCRSIELEGDPVDQKTRLPSEIAKQLFNEAQHDYHRFCGLDDKMQTQTPQNTDDFYLVSTDCEPTHLAYKVSVSAEF